MGKISLSRAIWIGFNSIVAGCAIIYISLCILFAYEFAHANDPITDRSKYVELLSPFRKAGLAKYFPDTCPENTIGFYFEPGFLQAGSVLQLRVSVSDKELAQIIADVPKQISDTDSAGKPSGSHCPPHPFVFRQSQKTSSHMYELPDTYELWNHTGIASTYEGEANWNHGKVDGIAIDKRNGEVLYYTEVW